jgi:p-cumate 2,3-dioxygenase subunit beta
MITSSQDVTRSEVEDLLYLEAALLDGWRLDEWLELLTADATMEVPPTNVPDADPAIQLTMVDDDRFRLEARVRRLNSRRAHREFPWSRTRRFITNVRIVERTSDGVGVEASLLLYRFRYEKVDAFIGHLAYELALIDGKMMIRKRRTVLDMEALAPNGALSMIF